ncbi:hypothetical protein Leryth_012050 [Lithospermum erythrorhizon]|nr:hypothetical protein Leryth_012050 [Lithospermum erythrorhizon]
MRNLAHGGACSECTTNCLLVHKNPMYPFNSVDRFFKRISGKDLSEVMFVPSRVAHEKKWRKYINREACLEDTTGEKYPVKIDEVENAVAFTEGWCRFSSEHHLAEGDFVLFSHVPKWKSFIL